MTIPEPRLPDDFSDVEEIPPNSGRLRVALEITVAVLVLVGIYFLFAPSREIELPPLQPQEIDPIIRAQIDAAEQEAHAPTAAAQSENPQTRDAETDSQKQVGNDTAVAMALPEGDAARKLIGDLRSGGTKLSQSEILQQARTFQQSGALTDAYLLLYFAARQGDGQAAFDLASLQDPNHFKAGSSLLEEPDAFQAQKWYSTAAAHNITQAKERLQALRSTLQQKADAGDMAARRLLLNWQ